MQQKKCNQNTYLFLLRTSDFSKINKILQILIIHFILWSMRASSWFTYRSVSYMV